jgi:ATP-binding cassette subfamily A (ABC1) protein 3
MIAVNIIIFTMLALYLDQVIPNEFGKKRHPLLCLHRERRTRISPEGGVEYIDDEGDNENLNKAMQNSHRLSANVEEVDAQYREQEDKKEVLKIQNVSKTYDNGKQAVKGLNLTFYKDQISCLLGHNGAGKTTTFSMLTGMLEFSSGEGKVFGKSIKTEMDEIRHFMGVCPQHNILFDELTVIEHLELFANFKV